MRRSMWTVFALLVSTGCTTTSVRPDVEAINDLLRARDARGVTVSVPEGDAFADAGADVDALLRAPLDADAAARIALMNNRSLKAAVAELGVPRGALVQAGVLPDPELEVAVAQAVEGHHALEVEVAVEYEISRLILMPQRRGIAGAELVAARKRVAGEVLETAYRARIALHEVQAAAQLLDVRIRALQSFQAAYETAAELHRVGNITDLDLANERAAVEAARLAVAEAEMQQLAARERVNTLLGLSGAQTAWQVAGRLPDPPADEAQAEALERRAVENSLELAELRARLDAAAGRSDLATSSGWLSHLAIGAHAEREDEVWEIGGHVSFALPFFDRGQGDAAAAEAALAGLRHRYVQTAVEVRAAARTARDRLESARRRALHLRDALLPARQKALDETMRAYNAMHTSVFQLLQVQRDVLGAGAAYVETLLDYWRARAGLDLVLAGRHGGLALGEMRISTPMAAQAGAGDAH